MVSAGLDIVLALVVAGLLSPPALEATTLTARLVPSGRRVRVTLVAPVTSWLWLPALTVYLVIGRPLSLAGCQATWIAPRALATVVAFRPAGGSGTVYGTTVLLTGDAFELAPLSLTE